MILKLSPLLNVHGNGLSTTARRHNAATKNHSILDAPRTHTFLPGHKTAHNRFENVNYKTKFAAAKILRGDPEVPKLGGVARLVAWRDPQPDAK